MRKKEVFILFLIGTLLLPGCGTQTAKSSSESTDAEKSSTVVEVDTSDMFSERDKEVGYEESESTVIQLADNATSCESDAVTISENTVTITEEGTYVLSGTLTDGMVIVEAEDTDKVQLVLNNVNISNSTSAALYIRSADKVFVTMAAESENTVENGGTYTAIDENNIDAAIFSKSDLTFNGEGTLAVTADEGHGIVSKDDLVFTSGVYRITSAGHGIAGKDSVRIANGTYEIAAGKDGIHAENADDTSLGFVYLADGSFDITAAQDGISAGPWFLMEEGTYKVSAEDDGIHGDASVMISGGSIDITESYEGIEGLSIHITGGEISVMASDDGVNAAGGNDNSGSEGPGGDQFAMTEGAGIYISGGTLHVNAFGDGLDSNGDITVSGGETYVSGPANDGNGTLDYSKTAVITGGIFVASGSSGMAQNFSSSSTQGVMLVQVDAQEANTGISLTDSEGAELISWTAGKAYSSVIISCPGIEQGETYTLKAGTSEENITMESLVYGNGSQMGGAPGEGGAPGTGNLPGNGDAPAMREAPGRESAPEREEASGTNQL